jgi:hypothetical protein
MCVGSQNPQAPKHFKLQKLKCEIKVYAIGNWFRGKKLYSEATIIWIFIIKSNDIVKKIGQY